VFIKGELQRRQTADMFGDGEPVDFKDIVAAANRELERMYGPGVETIGLFDRPAAEPVKPAAAPDPYDDWLDQVIAAVAKDREISADEARSVVTAGPNAAKTDADMRRSFEAMYSPGTAAYAHFGADPTKGLKRTPQETAPEPDFDPVAAVNAAYNFDKATDDFKAELAQSLDDEDYSPFATAREFDQAVKSHGGTVSWALVPGAILDSAAAHGTADDEDDWGDVSDDWGDADGELVTDGVLILDGDFAGHPFRGNQHRRAKLQTHHAARASREAKRADRRAAGHDRVLQYAHSSAAHAHKQAAKDATGKTKSYHAKMAAFHAKRAKHHEDKLNGEPITDSVSADLLLDSAWPDADMVILDGVGGDFQGVIRKGARVLGRAVIGGDGKGMIYTGAKGADRVRLGNGEPASWSDPIPFLVNALFGRYAAANRAQREQKVDPLKNVHPDELDRRTTKSSSLLATIESKIQSAIESGKSRHDPEVAAMEKRAKALQKDLKDYAAAKDRWIKTRSMADQAHAQPAPSTKMSNEQTTAAPANTPRDADAAYLRSIIAKKIDLSKTEVMDRIEALIGTYERDAEMTALIESAVEVIKVDVMARARAAI
jgi:hypothetical protein